MTPENEKLSLRVSMVSGITAIIIALVTLLQYCSMKDSIELQREMFSYDKKPDILLSSIIDTVRKKLFIKIENFSDNKAKDVQITLSIDNSDVKSNSNVNSRKFNLRENQIKYWDITTYKPKMVFAKYNNISNNVLKLKISFYKASDEKTQYDTGWFSIVEPTICNNTISKELDLIN
jgi:hypothetical protein